MMLQGSKQGQDENVLFGRCAPPSGLAVEKSVKINQINHSNLGNAQRKGCFVGTPSLSCQRACEGLKVKKRWGCWGWWLGGWVGCWGWELGGGEDVEDEDCEGVRRVRRLSWGQLGMSGGRVEHVTDGPDHYWDLFCEHLSRLSMKADDITWYQEKNRDHPILKKATFENLS